MNKNILLPLLLTPVLAHAELAPLGEDEMEMVSGKGISIDARVDFAQDDNWIAYRRILVDNNGDELLDTNNDGYVNVAGGVNAQKKDAHNGYNVVYKDPRADGGDYLIRNPYYVILGKITGGISFDNLQLDFVDKIILRKDRELGADHIDQMPNKAALKWTLPEKIVFHDFEVEGLYVSEDKVIDKPGNHPAGHPNAGEFFGDNKVLGLRVDGPVYLPSSTNAYVFITSD